MSARANWRDKIVALSVIQPMEVETERIYTNSNKNQQHKKWSVIDDADFRA